MKTMSKWFLTFLPLLLLSACISSPLQGWLITYTGSHSSMVDKGAISSAKIVKKGESCSWSAWIFKDIYYGGGGDVKEAADSANIKKIAVVDRRSFSLLFDLVFKECVLVYGE
ncbi:MAG TPA: TRL domain-containing protein [Leptospiraceae bacterium]|nr:TRL domain-containing protein [Leptospiraceae bacterium]